MGKYIVIKELPDANVGTEVNWEEGKNCYSYKKCAHVSPFDKTYLTAGQVTQTSEFFTKAEDFPEYYGYHNPVFSRKNVIEILKDFDISTKVAHEIDVKLRVRAKVHATTILDKKNIL